MDNWLWRPVRVYYGFLKVFYVFSQVFHVFSKVFYAFEWFSLFFFFFLARGVQPGGTLDLEGPGIGLS